MAVVIAKNIKKETKYFDINGNEINIETKEIIKPAEKRQEGLTPEQVKKLQEKMAQQAKMEEEGKKPEDYRSILKEIKQ